MFDIIFTSTNANNIKIYVFTSLKPALMLNKSYVVVKPLARFQYDILMREGSYLYILWGTLDNSLIITMQMTPFSPYKRMSDFYPNLLVFQISFAILHDPICNGGKLLTTSNANFICPIGSHISSGIGFFLGKFLNSIVSYFHFKVHHHNFGVTWLTRLKRIQTIGIVKNFL